MRKYYIYFAISAIIIVGLQAKYFSNLHEIFLLTESQKIEKAIYEAIYLECHHRIVSRDHVEFKSKRIFADEMSQEMLDSILAKHPLPPKPNSTGGDVYDILDMMDKGVIKKEMGLNSQQAQDNLFSKNKDVNLPILDSLLSVRLKIDYKTQILLCDSTNNIIDSIGVNSDYNYESGDIQLGTKGFRKIQFNLYIPLSHFMKQALLSLVLSILTALISLIILIYLIKTIHINKNILEVREQNINGVIHDLKSPLVNVKTTLDVVGMINTDSGISQIIRSNQVSIDNMIRRVESLLNAVKSRSGKISVNREVVTNEELKHRVENIKAMLEQTYKRKDANIEVFNKVTKDVNIDVMHFDTVILNMIDNSLKYSDDKVKVDVSLENTSSGGLSVVIKDDGFGIEKKYFKHIFEQSYRLSHKEIAGHGIGLYLVRAIAIAHNGDVQLVNSKIGEGSEFMITFNK
ncbi:MAG: HAMP domain-containing sensor histidine kinase [Rikenellaceae bacterium]